MAAAMTQLVRNLSQSIASERLGDLPDAELLRRILAGDEPAFEAVVRRHGPAVLAAARAVLNDPADVEDVFQATFLALWRGGRHIRKCVSLGSWLYGVARRAALKALARSRRRRQVEQRPPRPDATEAPDLSWREACRVLHEEIERLPEQYRGPIVLCHLEGRTRDEAAKELGWTLDTLRGRLERGRAMLKRRLTRRGVAFSAGLLAWLAGESADAGDLPAGLVNITVRSIRVAPATVAALLPAAGAAWPRRGALAAAVLLAGGIVAAGGGGERGEDKASKNAGTSPAARPAEEQPPARPDESPKIVVKGRVVDPAGKPVAQAKLEAHRWNIGDRVKATADGDGRFTLELIAGQPKIGKGEMRIVAAGAGFAPAVIEIPAKSADDFTVTLPEGIPLEGRVVTLEGQPVAGAEVRVKTLEVFAPGDLDKHLKAMQEAGERVPGGGKGVRYLHVYLDRYPQLLAELSLPVKTDRDGRFRIPNVGRDRLLDLTLSGPTIQHVELVARTQAGPPVKIDHQNERNRFTVLPSPFEHIAKPARLLRGTIREKGSGKPVAGVKVIAKGTTATATTDAAGRYELGGCPKSASYAVTATPPLASTLFVAERTVADTAGLEPLTVDIDLLPGIRVTGRILDAKTHKPAAGSVEYYPLPGNEHLSPKRDGSGTQNRAHVLRGTEAATDGTYSITVAPGPGLIMVKGDSRVYLDACVDPEEILPGQKRDLQYWGNRDALQTLTGENEVLLLTQALYRAIEAINPKPQTKTFEFDIDLTPTTKIAVRFIDPKGKPVAGVSAQVPIELIPGQRYSDADKWVDINIIGVNPKRTLTFYAVETKSGLCGQFIVRGDEKEKIEFRLQPGVTLTGRLVDADGKPVAGAKIWGSWSEPGTNGYRSQNPPGAFLTDADGKFRATWLLPYRQLGISASLPRHNSVERVKMGIPPLNPGETRDVGTLTLPKNQSP